MCTDLHDMNFASSVVCGLLLLSCCSMEMTVNVMYFEMLPRPANVIVETVSFRV